MSANFPQHSQICIPFAYELQVERSAGVVRKYTRESSGRKTAVCASAELFWLCVYRLNNTTDPKTKKYTITQVNSKHKTFLTRDCMKGRFMTFYVTILKKKTIFWTFSVSCPAASMNSRTNLNAVSVRAIITHALQEISTYNFKIGRSAQFSGCIESLFSQF